MNLALNDLQRLICHKPKQPTNHSKFHSYILAEDSDSLYLGFVLYSHIINMLIYTCVYMQNESQ